MAASIVITNWLGPCVCLCGSGRGTRKTDPNIVISLTLGNGTQRWPLFVGVVAALKPSDSSRWSTWGRLQLICLIEAVFVSAYNTPPQIITSTRKAHDVVVLIT